MMKNESTEKMPSIAVLILDLIESRGGMTAGQIQCAAYELAHGLPVSGTTFKVGMKWWSTNLGGYHPMGMKNCGRTGLLEKFCYKRDGRWFRNDVNHNGHPFAGLTHSRGPEGF